MPKVPLDAAFKTHHSCGYARCTYHLLPLGSLIFSFLEFSIFLMPSVLCLCSIDLKLFFFFLKWLLLTSQMCFNIMTLLQGHGPHFSIGGVLLYCLKLSWPLCTFCINAYAVVHAVPTQPSAPHFNDLSFW